MSETKRLQRNGEIMLIPISLIVKGDNDRINYGDIEALARSIGENGVQTPIRVKKIFGEDQYILKAGYRRMRAISLFNETCSPADRIETVRAIILPKDYNEDDALFEHIISNDGLPFSKIEEGNVYRKLINRGFKETQISERVGKNVMHVRICLATASLPKPIQKKIAEGTISDNTAVELFKQVKQDETKFEEELKKALDTSAGKKIKPRHVAALTAKPAIKRLEEVSETLKERKVKSEKAKLLTAIINVLKTKGTVEDLLKLFE